MHAMLNAFIWSDTIIFWSKLICNIPNIENINIIANIS